MLFWYFGARRKTYSSFGWGTCGCRGKTEEKGKIKKIFEKQSSVMHFPPNHEIRARCPWNTKIFLKNPSNRTFISLLCTECATNFYPLLNFPPFFLPLFLSSNDRKQKSVVYKAETQKVRIQEPRPFLGVFWATRMGTLNLIRALMYWLKSVQL